MVKLGAQICFIMLLIVLIGSIYGVHIPSKERSVLLDKTKAVGKRIIQSAKTEISKEAFVNPAPLKTPFKCCTKC